MKIIHRYSRIHFVTQLRLHPARSILCSVTVISPSLSSREEAEEAKEEEKKEKKEIKEANLKRHEERCDCRCLAAVIATAELNKKAGGRTRTKKRDERGEVERGWTTGGSRRDRPANQTLSWISLPPRASPDELQGRVVVVVALRAG